MKKICLSLLLCLSLSLAFPTVARARELSLGGEAVGIRIRTDGLLVAGLSGVETGLGSLSPARDAGIRAGDRIMAVDGMPVSGAGDLIEAVGRSGGQAVELSLRRGEDALTISVEPVQTEQGQWMLGLWLKDGIAGIGTLTFCDPGTGIYGALGHSVTEEDSGQTLPLGSGNITRAEIVGVNRGSPGTPGELNGCADEGQVLGTVEKNSVCGIYGKASAPLGGEIIETGTAQPGPASILSTVDGRQVREFAVEITRVFRDGEGSHVTLKVTDPGLLAQTGGIVQGMSGSPILQNGKLVAAVTHVFLSDPTRGYGLSIQDMLAEAGLDEEQAA